MGNCLSILDNITKLFGCLSGGTSNENKNDFKPELITKNSMKINDHIKNDNNLKIYNIINPNNNNEFVLTLQKIIELQNHQNYLILDIINNKKNKNVSFESCNEE